MPWLDPKPSGYYIRDRNPSVSIPLGKISPKEARHLLHKFEAEKAEGGGLADNSKIPLMVLYEQYLAYLESNNYAPSTLRTVPQDLRPFIKFAETTKALSSKIEAWRDRLQNDTSRYGRRLAVDTVAHRLRVIQSFCSWLTEEKKLFRKSPFSVSVPAGRKDAGRALQGDEVKALFKHWPMHEPRAKLSKLFFYIVYYGGTRLTEMLGDPTNDGWYPGAQYEHLDRKHCILKLEKTKGGEAREVALPRFVVDMIPEGSGPIFCGKIGPWTLRRHYGMAQHAAGIKGRLRIHDGRVSCATEWARKIRNERSSMNQFGWKTPIMPIHYNKVATQERIEHAQKIDYE